MARPSWPDGDPSIEVLPAVGRFDDFALVAGVQKPGGRGCWCMAYRDSRVSNEDRPDYMRGECGSEPGPGVIAYVDGVPAGWLSIAPRSSYRRLMNSRTIPFVDEREAWSAVCFVVRAGFRGHGLMYTLLEGGVAHAHAHGAEVVEGYPAEVGESGRNDVISGYIGSTRLFERSGFTKAQLTSSTRNGAERWIMRRELGSAAPSS